MSALDLAASVRAGKRSAREVVQESFASISAGDAELHCFLVLDEEGALAQADAVDAAVARGEDPGPLAGVPIALKDNLCTRNLETTCASRILEGWRPPYDATVVRWLRDAGAVAVGKTNLDEFAMGSSTENSAFGPTRNPWNTGRVPGGSSGGSAAAVAAGFVPLALGSDTGGSIRQPASLCGVVGVKPTYGLVSRYGLVAFASSLDQIGPFACTVADAALLLECIAGHDPMDSTSIDEPAPGLRASLDQGVSGLRIGVVQDFLADASAATSRSVLDAAEGLAKMGATVEHVAIPELMDGLGAYYLIAPAEASSNLSRYDGVRYGLRSDGEDVAAMNANTREAGFGPEVKRRIILGTYVLSAGYYDAYYALAQRVRTLVQAAFRRAYDSYDVLIGPTTPGVAFAFGDKADPLSMYLSDLYTIPSNLAGDPAVSVPFALGEDDLPVGVQVLAPALGEAVMFRVAAALEQLAPPGGARTDLGERSRAMTPTILTASSGKEYELVVGLEVHCELATTTKLFCGCPNSFGSEPNTNVCPVCLGLPGSLPVLNRRAVEFAMRIGLALNCTVAPSVFHRKNYFYPDMPKDYQISQYDAPINIDGYLELPDGSTVGIERAHIEEDTGKSTHVGGGGRIHGSDYSLIDYNRAGVPLVEIVSRPDITSPEQARSYVAELRAVLVATGASDGRMEEGSLRADANVSVRPVGSTELGTRCEVKNLNSLRSLGRAIDYEARRQVELVDGGERVVQETRHWNEQSGSTSSLRSKEEAYDYRYFPEPDLVPLVPDEAFIEAARSAFGALPAERRARLNALDASGQLPLDQVVTVVDLGLDDLVVAATERGADLRLALARASNEAAARPDEARSLDPDRFAALVGLESSGSLSATQAKSVLAELLEQGGDPAEIASRLGFEGLGDDALEAVIDEVLAAHPEEWQRFVGGDPKVTGFLLGQIMRATSGKANGKTVTESLNRRKAG